MNATLITTRTLASGGCTYNPSSDTYLSGEPFYAVAMYPECEQVLSLKDFTPGSIYNYAKEHKNILKHSKNSIGTWIDRDTNEIYLDISRTVSDRDVALAIAKRTNQLAIFDLLNLEEIRL
jgi:hypothetical protein